ncbi:hypothetical protein J3R30DRAFT_3553808 [Lentinula aciculospora]|uniref:Mid2 domain-containing protein n=1 Tax=Lentinula aciculospora TaxID=153920 RepID=A0A9W9DG59_9AGAR|nr:hypothetical protein J3R30DRAFT_3553808 [Lentinula aciculospora]
METRFIDDQFGDLVTQVLPNYSPVNGWTQGANCTGCGFHPNIQQAFNQTWHDTTHHTTDQTKSVQFGFTGTSLDVFCIIPNPSIPTLTSTYNLTFELDGQPLQQTFTHTSDSSNVFQFNVSVLSLENLALAPHNFVMLAASTVVNSTLQFDYAMYTIPSTSTSLSSSSAGPSASLAATNGRDHAVPAIIGAAVGGTLFMGMIVAMTFWYLRYKRRGMPLRYLKSSSSRAWDYGQGITRIEPFPLMALPRPLLETASTLEHPPHTTNNIQRSETSITYPSTIITGPSYHQTSDGYLSPSGRSAHQNSATPSHETSFSSRGQRNRQEDTSIPNSGRIIRQTDNETIGTTSNSGPVSSVSSSRRRDVIRELRGAVEDLKRQQRELIARLPPSYEEYSSSNDIPP